jgi:hypothetical protein
MRNPPEQRHPARTDPKARWDEVSALAAVCLLAACAGNGTIGDPPASPELVPVAADPAAGDPGPGADPLPPVVADPDPVLPGDAEGTDSAPADPLPGGEGDASGAADPGTIDGPPLASLRVHLRADAGQYLTAEAGGGQGIWADRWMAGAWETFILVDVNEGALEHGDTVAVQTSDARHFFRAPGDGTLSAAATGVGPSETFVLHRLSGAGPVFSGDRIALESSEPRFVVAEAGGGGTVNANRQSIGAWETFALFAEGRAPSGPSSIVPADTRLVLPRPRGAVLATITGYEMDSACPWDPGQCEEPLYRPYDRDTAGFWQNLLEELLASRVNVMLMHGRGCLDPATGDAGNGNMCPRLLRHFIAAIDRAGAADVARLGMFDDTGAYPGARNLVEGRPHDTPFDLADHTSWRFFWDHNMRIWFDTVPPELWYRLDGRPIVAFWSLADAFFANQQGNASALLRDLRARFIARYGEDPLFIVDRTWILEDSTLTPTDAQGVNDWFNPPQNNFTYFTWGGARWGAAVPSYRDPDTTPGCGVACREVLRRDGETLRAALDLGLNARVTLLEGWTNIAESAGYYRSAVWRLPNQYINIVREYADPEASTLRLEVEAADRFADLSPGNSGGAYRDGDLDIGALSTGAGWFVGWTETGEWLEFVEVVLVCGSHRFSARLATASDAARLRLEVDGQSLGSVALPATGGWDAYVAVHLGQVELDTGRHDLRLVVESGGVNVDWVFSRRAAACP